MKVLNQNILARIATKEEVCKALYKEKNMEQNEIQECNVQIYDGENKNNEYIFLKVLGSGVSEVLENEYIYVEKDDIEALEGLESYKLFQNFNNLEDKIYLIELKDIIFKISKVGKD